MGCVTVFVMRPIFFKGINTNTLLYEYQLYFYNYFGVLRKTVIFNKIKTLGLEK